MDSDHEMTVEDNNSDERSSLDLADPLSNLENVQEFIDRLDHNFEQHIKSLGQFHQLLELKAKIDQKYARSLNLISLQFIELSKIAVNPRIKDLVLALGRNFKNVSTNIESMSYDLLTEAGIGFDKCKDDTSTRLNEIKNFLKGTLYTDYIDTNRYLNTKRNCLNLEITIFSLKRTSF